jgi:hypothetical protein
MRRSIFTCLALISLEAYSQKNDFGSWNVINTKVNLSEKWNLFNELQVRSQSFYANHFYYEIKGGASYAISKNFSVLVGIGKYKTFTDGGSFKQPVTASEFRLWQQLTMNHFLDRIKFEHRYRVEQRWFKDGYRNRFRYRLNVAVPINAKKIEPKVFYASAFNEIFLTNTSPYFERNRVFVGAGYQFNNNLSLQPGYVYQYDYRNNVGSGKHFFQLTLIIEVDAHKNTSERMPGNID